MAEREKRTNKEKILDLVRECTKDGGKGTEASWIAEELGIKRNLASSLLNELVNEGALRKLKSRPVLFYYNEKDVKKKDKNDPFCQFIGCNYSLKEQIQKCKLSVFYPNRGMPVMLLGPSGVGKSLLAEYIYEYAKYTGKIPEDAPFIVLNCADYANNKELLSSVLFGYKKGAFTGAFKDTKGLIEEADHGYLFLDEVHRLPPEGQEKLFRYIDKGVVSKMGDSGRDISLNVRLVFATTEDTESMLDTFLRRIPISVRLPVFAERSIEERFQLICKLFSDEAKIMGVTFKVSHNVMNQLMIFDGKGNIGTLKNLIKLCCTNAYSSQKPDLIKVTIEDLQDYDAMGNYFQRTFIEEDVVIKQQWTGQEYEENSCAMTESFLDLDQLEKMLIKFQKHTISNETFRTNIYNNISRFMDFIVYSKSDILAENIYLKSVENILDYLQNNYGLRYNGTNLTVLSRLLVTMNHNQIKLSDDIKEQVVRIEELLRYHLFRYYKMSAIFYEMAHQTLDYEASPEYTKIFTALYFYYNMDHYSDLCNAIIVCHGHATASSISSMMNRVFGTYIFEAFDMPYDTPIKEIVKKIKIYLERTDTSKGLLIFVDMGTLLGISDEIKDYVEGDLGIINNITTQMALEAGERILRREKIDDIMKKAVSNNNTNFTFIEQSEKQNAVVVCCMTGIGTAVKLRDMLKECCEEIDLQILEQEYGDLKEYGGKCDVFQNYNVLFVISTAELLIEGKKVIPLNDLITESGEKIINEMFHGHYPAQKIKNVMRNIVKSFSMTNIIGQLTILNPDKIVKDVEKAMDELEILCELKFSADLRKMLYIHISIMVERLILEKGADIPAEDETFLKCHLNFVEKLKKSFSVIQSKYNVSVNMREMKMIHNLIESKGFQLN